MINVFLTQSSKTLLKNKDSDSALFLEDGKTFLGYARTTLVVQCTLALDMRFATFLSGGFTTMIVMNPPEKKLEKRTSVQWYINYPVTLY